MPDLTTISLGAGLQSSLLCEMVIAGELPKPDAVLFADTGDEPDYVYDQVAYLRRKLATVGVPLITVSNGNLARDVYSHKRFVAMPLFTVLGHGQRGRRQQVPDEQAALIEIEAYTESEPEHVTGFNGEAVQLIRVGRLKRQCTSEYKIVPIEKEIRVMLLEMRLATETKTGAIRVNPGVTVETWLGITVDEAERMKPSRKQWLRNRWPLIEKRMSRADCVAWYEKRGLPVPGKSSCRRCPFHDDTHWLDMKQNRPDDWREMVRFDHDLRSGKLRIDATAKGELYLHKSLVPLDQVMLTNQGQETFNGCDAGYCWT